MDDSELVSVEQMGDGTYRVYRWPFDDKIRNIATREEAHRIAASMLPEVRAAYTAYETRTRSTNEAKGAGGC